MNDTLDFNDNLLKYMRNACIDNEIAATLAYGIDMNISHVLRDSYFRTTLGSPLGCIAKAKITHEHLSNAKPLDSLTDLQHLNFLFLLLIKQLGAKSIIIAKGVTSVDHDVCKAILAMSPSKLLVVANANRRLFDFVLSSTTLKRIVRSPSLESAIISRFAPMLSYAVGALP